MKKLLTIREAAEFLGVHTNTLRNLDRRGEFKAHRVGNTRNAYGRVGEFRYNLSDLKKFKKKYYSLWTVDNKS